MSATRLELILEARPGEDLTSVSQYLRSKGFDPLPMKVGLLLSDDLDRLRSLWPAIGGPDQGSLAVPEELKRSIAAIHVVKPRSFHKP